MREVVILLCSPDACGKTTLAASLMDTDSYNVVSDICNLSRHVTIDWVYSTEVVDPIITGVTLNSCNCMSFRDTSVYSCNHLFGEFLRNLGLIGKDDISVEELSTYVNESICSNSNGMALVEKLLREDYLYLFIDKIRISVKPSPSLASVLQENTITLVLRDSYADFSRYEYVPDINSGYVDYYNLDYKEVHAVIILMTETASGDLGSYCPYNLQWYLRSKPVFVVTRDSKLSLFYDQLFGVDDPECFEAFEYLITNFASKFRFSIVSTPVSYYNFLEKLNIGRSYYDKFSYEYHVYPDDLLQFFVPSFSINRNTVQDAQLCNDTYYNLYKYFVFKNMNRILDLVIEYMNIVQFSTSKELFTAVKDFLHNKLRIADKNGHELVTLTRCSRNPGREIVCDDILSDEPVLGYYNGIASVSDCFVEHPGALGSAVAIYKWLIDSIADLPDIDNLVDNAYNKYCNNVTRYTFNKLIRFHLNKYIESKGDSTLYDMDTRYPMLNRDLICNAINSVRNNSKLNDAVDSVAFEIVEEVFKDNAELN